MFLQDCSTWAHKLHAGSMLASSFYKEHPKLHTPQQIAFVGMGGSGITGRIIKELVAAHCPVPIFIIDSAQIPAHINEHTLCFVLSYSGNTWETLEAFQHLAQRSIPIIAMAHGGKLAQRAQELQIPLASIPNAATPRSSLGYTLGFFLQFFNDLKLFTQGAATLQLYIKHAQQRIPLYLDQHFFQDFLTIAMAKKFFYMWGISGYGDACAYRAQTQFNENSKIPAVHSSLPELNHNLLVGFSAPSEDSLIVLFTPNTLPKSINASINAVYEILTNRGASLYKPTLFGDNFMVQFFDMILWADFASYHFGKMLGVDVAAVEIIDLLKKTHGQKLLS